MDVAAIQAAKGHFGRSVYKFGFNTGINTVEETVWDAGGIYSYASTASAANIVSTSASDAMAGTGAQKVRIEGLDAEWKFQSVEVDLNGLGVVSTSEVWRRIFRAYVTQAGALEVNAGDIIIDTDGVTRAQISIDQGQTLMAVYTVPAGLTGYVVNWSVGSGASLTNKYLDARLIVRKSTGVIQTKARTTLSNTTIVQPFEKAIIVQSMDDIEIRAHTSSGSDEVSGTFSIVLQS